MMSKIANGPSEAVHKPHEDVAAEVCTDASMLNDKELDAVVGGGEFLVWKFTTVMVPTVR